MAIKILFQKTEKELYNNIKENIRDYDKFLKELLKASEIYCNIIGAQLANYNELNVNEKFIGDKKSLI